MLSMWRCANQPNLPEGEELAAGVLEELPAEWGLSGLSCTCRLRAGELRKDIILKKIYNYKWNISSLYLSDQKLHTITHSHTHILTAHTHTHTHTFLF